MRLICANSSSRSMNTTPFAVAGRWRATTMPATCTRERFGRSCSSTLVSVPSGRCGRMSSSGMDADRQARGAVVGEHPLPHRRLGEIGCRHRRLERERELLLLAFRSRHRQRARHEAELPEQLAAALRSSRTRRTRRARAARLPESCVCCTSSPDRHVRPRRDDRLRVVLPHTLHVLQPDADRTVLERAVDAAAVHVRRPRLDAAALSVTHERRRRVEAHRLRVQQRDEELGRRSDGAATRTGTRAARTRPSATSGSRTRRTPTSLS